MTGYYEEKLAGRRLKRCYEVAPPRVKRYLEAEIGHVLGRLRPGDTVLELGCGYGRVTSRMARIDCFTVGIDTAWESLELARRTAEPGGRCAYVLMDAVHLGFKDGAFDGVVCVQNGICAFGADPAALLREALRVTRGGGVVLLSSYVDRFWPDRLAWFEAQAKEGLMGAVDRVASRDGTIVCKDGFRAGRMNPERFRALCSDVGVIGRIEEVDGSSVFCEIVK